MNREACVRVEKLVHGGEGLARLEDGGVVFIRDVLPGELVSITITRKRKGVYEAVPREVIEPSPDRVEPPCLGDRQCTGATWAHIAYPAQLRFKQEILSDTLQRTGGMAPRRPLPVIPSPRRDHYRLRTQFNVRLKDGTQRLGFFRPGSYDLIEVENGYLLHPVINSTLSAVRSHITLLPPLEEVHINASPAGEVHVLLFGSGPFPAPEAFFERLRRDAPGVVGVTGYAGRQKAFSLGTDRLTLDVEGLTLSASEGNFFQVNWEQNRNMVRTVLDFAAPADADTVLDLYCGVGNFALPLARTAERVIGIESGFTAIEDARRNAERNGITNVEFLADDLQRGLKTLRERIRRAGVIVLDPPRAGATLKTLERILAFVPRRIVYVSCNPATLARDLKFFHLFGFRLDRLQPVDMFPWTFHIEAVAEMVREPQAAPAPHPPRSADFLG